MEREEGKKLSLRGSYELLQEEENEFIFSSFLPFFLERQESFLPPLSQISVYLSRHACMHTHTQIVLLYNFLYYDALKSGWEETVPPWTCELLEVAKDAIHL